MPSARERLYAANAEHDLLTHPHLLVAAVKLGGNQSVFGVVFRNVGVEQVNVDAADAQFPNLGEDFAIQDRHRNQKLRVVAVHFANRQVMKILVEADRLLHAVLVDLLPEIAVPIKQTDRDEVQIEIAGRFAMIAGENAEAAGIIWD